jgi:hypothetical protein
VRVPYHESKKNLLRSSNTVLALPYSCKGRSWITAMSAKSGRRWRIFACNCLAMIRQAEKTRQPKPGLDFQMRRKDETHN